MVAPIVYRIIVQVGKRFLGTNSKRIAQNLIKKGGKRIPKTKLPKNAKINKAPDVTTKVPNVKLPLKKPNADKLPKNVQLRKDPPVGRKTTSPKKSTTPKAPAKPKVSTTAPKPSAKTRTDRRYRPGDDAKLVGSGRGGSTPRSYKVGPGKTNRPPPKLGNRPALLRSAPLESGPEIDKSTVTPRNTPKTKTDRKFVPKTTPKTKKTKPPLKKTPPRKGPPKKTAPATGPVTNESFGKAFRRNRNAGKPTFTWKGRKYTTRLKEETITQHKKKFGVEGKY